MSKQSPATRRRPASAGADPAAAEPVQRTLPGSVPPTGYEVQRQALSPAGGGPYAVQREGGGATAKKPTVTYESLQAELGAYTEGDPNLGPLGLTKAFVINDAKVPEHVKFGPGSAMTKVVRQDQGVQAARAAYAASGTRSHFYKFSFLQFAQETYELSLTTHMLGSYTVKMAPTPDGKVLFVVYNSTSRQSGTRNPFTGKGKAENKSRADSEWFGTIHQRYYWTEPLPTAPKAK